MAFDDDQGNALEDNGAASTLMSFKNKFYEIE